ncbi:hypothetical protein [Ramlibacter sp.]|uniref:hypothetical protein n=1 Tax=Ramlibacter sp. TaxID=1917967 RepID=UPI0035AEC003
MNILRSLLAAPFTLLVATGALAHDGHGASAGGHWHATDTLGFVVLAVAVAAAIWLGRGK